MDRASLDLKSRRRRCDNTSAARVRSWPWLWSAEKVDLVEAVSDDQVIGTASDTDTHSDGIARLTVQRKPRRLKPISADHLCRVFPPDRTGNLMRPLG